MGLLLLVALVSRGLVCQGLCQLPLPNPVLDVGHEALVDGHHHLPDIGLRPNVGHRLVELGEVFGQGLEVGAGDLMGLYAAKTSTVFKIDIFARNTVGYNNLMIALKLAISGPIRGAKNSFSLHL